MSGRGGSSSKRSLSVSRKCVGGCSARTIFGMPMGRTNSLPTKGAAWGQGQPQLGRLEGYGGVGLHSGLGSPAGEAVES